MKEIETFKALVEFYIGQLHNKPALRNNESSVGYSSLRARWNLPLEGARAIEKECRACLGTIPVANYAHAHGRLWQWLHRLHLYIIPALIAISVAVEPVIQIDPKRMYEQFATVEAVPIYVFCSIFIGLSIVKAILKKTCFGKFRQETIEIAEHVADARDCIIALTKDVVTYKRSLKDPKKTPIVIRINNSFNLM